VIDGDETDIIRDETSHLTILFRASCTCWETTLLRDHTTPSRRYSFFYFFFSHFWPRRGAVSLVVPHRNDTIIFYFYFLKATFGPTSPHLTDPYQQPQSHDIALESTTGI
jgi:hypothetical protein